MALGFGFLWKSQSRAQLKDRPGDLTPQKENILRNDQEKLEKNIKKEIVKDKDWANIIDYSKSPKILVNANNVHSLFKLANGSLASLENCLKKDFCGMEKRNDNDSYFDQNNTPGHILLGRNLSIMLESLRQNPKLSKDIDWDLILELTDNSNEKVQVLALELIKNFNPKNKDSDNYYKIVDGYKGNAKAQGLLKLSTNRSPEEHATLLNSLEKSFAMDDPHTVISVIEQLAGMNLSSEDLTNISKNLCHFYNNGSDDPNWKMIRYEMGKVGVDLESVCSIKN